MTNCRARRRPSFVRYPVMLSKVELRRQMRALLPPDDRAGRSARICEKIAALGEWQSARIAAIFAPQPREPDVDGLWTFAGGKTLAYPRMDGEHLVLHAAVSSEWLQPARFGIREPSADTSPA